MNLLKGNGLGAFLHSLIAKPKEYRYVKHVQQKAVGLALVGYQAKGAQSAIWTFFVRIISMHSHFMAKLERDTFECAGNLLRQSTNPFQLCHPYKKVNGKASINSDGAHNHV